MKNAFTSDSTSAIHSEAMVFATIRNIMKNEIQTKGGRPESSIYPSTPH